MKKKINIMFMGIMGASPLFATINTSNVLNYKGECFKYNTATKMVQPSGDIKTYDVSSLSANDIISKLQKGVDGNSSGLNCDKFLVYYTTPQKDKSEDVTVQKMAKPINPFSKADFITIKSSKNSYFVGVSSKLQGAGVGYWIYKTSEVGKNKTIKHVFGLQRINWLNFFAKYVRNYCRQTNGIPPYIIYNQMAFLNAAGSIGLYLKNNPDATPSSINTSNVKALKNPGFFKLPQSICQDSLSDIKSSLADIKTYPQSGSKGYSYNLYGDDDSNKLFTENGFVINYPYIDFNHIDQIMGEFFTSFMFTNNIPRGIMFSDEKIKTKTKHWTTGKYFLSKTKHSRRDWNATSDSYDIIYAQYIQPFGAYSFTKDWGNIGLSYVASVNNIPALTRQLITLTPDNHQITHIFKKGGEIASLGTWSHTGTVSKKIRFKWVKFIITVATIAAIGVMVYTGAIFFTSGFAAGTAGFGSFLSIVSASPSILVGGLAGGTGLIGGGAALGIAGATVVGTTTATRGWFYKKPGENSGDNSVFSRMTKNLNNDIISTSSLKIKQIQIIPKLIQTVQPQSMISPVVYKTILMNTPTLGGSSRVIPKSEFLTNYGTYFNMYMYANHTDLGKDFYHNSDVAGWAKNFINNMQLKGNGTFMNPGGALTTIMQREWK